MQQSYNQAADRLTTTPSRMNGQKRILVLSWLTYCLAYTLRVNIAVVIPAIIADFGYSYMQMGLVTSLYFVTYMFGQLINGYLGDRVSSRLLIVIGLTGSALCNLGAALAPSYAILAICWGLNGLFQSMLWAPLMKTLSVWFHGYQLERVSFIMALSVIIGYAISWGASSILTTHLGWTYAFFLPVALVLLFTSFMAVLFRDKPDDTNAAIDIKPAVQPDRAASPDNAESPEIYSSGKIDSTIKVDSSGTSAEAERLPLLQFLRMIRLPGLLLIALTQGIIREGISIWFPTIIESSGRFAAGSPWLILVIVPAINLCGVIFVRRVNRFLKSDSIQTLLLIFALATGTALLLNLMIIGWFWLILLVMILLLSLTYGLTPVLTSIIPFQYARFKRVSLTAGLIDFSIYLGAAIAGLVSGWIADRYPWSRVMLLWLGAAIIGLAAATWRFYTHKNKQRFEQSIGHE
ncbi:MAG: MFS transporter [Bacillota bacterium]|nr:MFS transporter [Bacillota bacterium]